MAHVLPRPLSQRAAISKIAVQFQNGAWMQPTRGHTSAMTHIHFLLCLWCFVVALDTTRARGELLALVLEARWFETVRRAAAPARSHPRLCN